MRASAAAFLLALTCCSSPVPAPAPAPSPTKRAEEKFTAEAEAEESSRRDRILAALRKVPDHAWAGEYYQGDGLGVNQNLLLGPAGDFVFHWRGCLGVYDRNFGSLRHEGQKIHLDFIYPNELKGFQGVAAELIPVPWGNRHYLIPADEMADFCNAVQKGREPRQGAHGSFLLRKDDWKLALEGRPELPLEFRAWLLDRPISGTVTAVGSSRLHEGKAGIKFRISDVTLNVGKVDGVYPGMEFYFLDESGTSAKVTRVDGRESSAEIVEVLSEGSEGRTPKAGVSVSSKPPWR
jgi:hypothetical protein